MFTISTIGYSPEKLFGYDLYTKPYMKLAKRIHQILSTELSMHKAIHCFCNGTPGSNQLFGLIVKKMKEINTNVSMELILPGMFYSTNYNNDLIYDKIYSSADKITVLKNSLYTDSDLIHRDMYILEHSSLVIVVYDSYTNYDDHIEDLIQYTKDLHIPSVNPYFIPRDKYE